MFDLMLGGFLVSIPIGIMTRMFRVFTLGFCVGGVTISIMDRGLRGYAKFMWNVEALPVLGGAVVGYSLGYLAWDRVVLWWASL